MSQNEPIPCVHCGDVEGEKAGANVCMDCFEAACARDDLDPDDHLCEYDGCKKVGFRVKKQWLCRPHARADGWCVDCRRKRKIFGIHNVCWKCETIWNKEKADSDA